MVREEAVFGHRCALAYDGTSLHSACCLALPGADVFYRRGVPADDGLSIAWDEDQVAFDVPDVQSVLYPKVLVDASGHPWVAFMLFEGGFETAPQRAMIVRSSRTDGIWETAAGFPFALSAPSTETFPDPLGVALASGGTYWIWDPDGASPYVGRPWSEVGGFGPEERISEGAHRHGLFDAVAEGDDVHVSYGGGPVPRVAVVAMRNGPAGAARPFRLMLRRPAMPSSPASSTRVAGPVKPSPISRCTTRRPATSSHVTSARPPPSDAIEVWPLPRPVTARSADQRPPASRRR